MAFHHRSQSEQYQPQASQQPQTIESIIREHTDSQQSLDQLFNPTTPSVPLRNRNLPDSFFNPGLGASGDTTPNTNGTSGSRFHSRSISYGHQPQLQSQPQARALAQVGGGGGGTNFHARTNSTLAPMSDYNSNQSSYECLNSSSSTALNNTMSNNNHRDQRVTPMNTDSMPIVSQQVEYAPAADWYSPATSLEELRSPTSTNFQYQQLTTTTTTPHAQSIGSNLPATPTMTTTPTTTTPQSPLMQPTAPLRHNHMGLQPNGLHQPAYQAIDRRPQASNNNNNNSSSSNYERPTTQTGFTCPNTFSNNLHGRSMSFDQNCLSDTNQVSNQRDFHVRTGSILAPTPNGTISSTEQPNSIHQRNRCESTREFVNYTSINQSATGWSSSGCSSDDMSTATGGGGNFWNSRPQLVNDHQGPVLSHQHHYHYHQPMQARPPPTSLPNGRLSESGINAGCPTNSIQQPAFRHYGAQVFHGGM